MSAPLAAVRAALAAERAWLVGGAVRDRLLGRPVDDLDVALVGDPERAARAVRARTGGAVFGLSQAFGVWRIVGPGHTWHVDLLPLRDRDLLADLAARDFTINAMAEPLAGGELVDPHGGAADLGARLLRMVSPAAFDADPLRTLRAVRLAAELGLRVEAATLAAARAHAPGLERTAAERVWGELRRIVCTPEPAAALRLLDEAGAAAVVLPELLPMRGIDQNVYHHLDVYDHTLAVVEAVRDLERSPEPLGEHAQDVAAYLAEPFGDELTRWQALRFGALLHDVAKPQTRRTLPNGRVTFMGHDSEGAEVARGVMRRLRTSERLAEYVAALTRHHLRLGFLAHERPLALRSAHRYLVATAPYEIDATVISVADRLATRGRNAEPAIAAHLQVAREMLGHALARRAAEPQRPLVRGDELARELGVRPGQRLGEILAQLEEDRFAGEITTREEAIARARELLEASAHPRPPSQP